MNTSSPLNFIYSYPRLMGRIVLGIIGIALLVFSIFLNPSPNSPKTLWILDISLSMNAQDIKKDNNLLMSRFDVAKSLILSGVSESQGEFALATFGDVLQLQVPFSTDRSTFMSVLAAIGPRVYDGGTDIEMAMKGARLIYPHESIHIILLTDGENSGTGGEQLASLETNMLISIIGIGTREGSRMLQGYDANGNPRYKQYTGGDAITRIDTAYLSRLQESYSADLSIIDEWSDISSVEKMIASSKNTMVSYQKNGMLYLGASFLLLAIILVSYKKKQEIFIP